MAKLTNFGGWRLQRVISALSCHAHNPALIKILELSISATLAQAKLNSLCPNHYQAASTESIISLPFAGNYASNYFATLHVVSWYGPCPPPPTEPLSFSFLLDGHLMGKTIDFGNHRLKQTRGAKSGLPLATILQTGPLGASFVCYM